MYDVSFTEVMPKSIAVYSKCLTTNMAPRKVVGITSATSCNTMLKNHCKDFDGKSEYSCYRKIHEKILDKFKVDKSIIMNQHIDYVNVTDKETNMYHVCLKELKEKSATCLPSLRKKCYTQAIRATKVIRMRFQTVHYLLAKDPSIKVINYVRDPRGVVESRIRHIHHGSEKNKITALVHNAINLCKKVSNDIKEYRALAKQFPMNFMTLRYEDLIDKPIDNLRSIYKFIGEDLPNDVVTFFEDSLHANASSGPMGIKRKNATAAATQWQKNLDKDDLYIINRVCGDVMMAMGYKPL